MSSENDRLSIAELAEAVVVLVSVGFVVSIIYDWGFVRGLGVDFESFPTTVSDHFRTGLLWFPNLVLLVILFFAVEFQFKKIEKGLTEEEVISSSPNPEKTRKFREGPQKLAVWVLPLIVLNWVLLGDVFSSVLPVAFSLLWLAFSTWTYDAPLIRMRRGRLAHQLFTFMPVVFIVSYFSGYNAAVDAAVRSPTQVVVSFSAVEKEVTGKVLRHLESGVLIMQADSRMSVIRWDSISSMRFSEPYEPFLGIACEVFGRCGIADKNNGSVELESERSAD